MKVPLRTLESDVLHNPERKRASGLQVRVSAVRLYLEQERLIAFSNNTLWRTAPHLKKADLVGFRGVRARQSHCLSCGAVVSKCDRSQLEFLFVPLSKILRRQASTAV